MRDIFSNQLIINHLQKNMRKTTLSALHLHEAQ